MGTFFVGPATASFAQRFARGKHHREVGKKGIIDRALKSMPLAQAFVFNAFQLPTAVCFDEAATEAAIRKRL